MSGVIQLTGTAVDKARHLVASEIPHVTWSRIGRPDDQRHRTCRTFLEVLNRRRATTEALLDDLWLGVLDGDQQLVAALHAAPLLGSASQCIETLDSGSPGAGGPGWIARLLREVLIVEEVAVLPAQRRCGHAAALLVEVHRLGRLRGVKHVQAHAGSPAAQDLFRSAGYLVAPPQTPVPKQYQCDLITFWDHTYDHLSGSYVYNHVDQVT